MEQSILSDSKTRFEKVLVVFGEDLATVRTGRAKPDLVANIEVLAYGSRMKMFEVANISAPDSNMILIAPWDKGLTREIEKAVSMSELKLPCAVSGDTIRIVIPQLTEERRRDFVKLLHQKLESGKVMLRQARGEIKEKIDALESSGGISEDDIKRMLENLQKTTDEYMLKIDEMGRVKEKEIMAI